MCRLFVLFLFCIHYGNGKQYHDELDKYLITCHTTDFECFKRQYINLRDHFLLGNEKLNIAYYEAFAFKYGDTNTCIKLSGLEESYLTEVSLDSSKRNLRLTLQLPFRIQQVAASDVCVDPETAFVDVELQTGPLKKFSGNATIAVIYPYQLRKKKGEVHMLLDEEDLDVVLDIPDYTIYDMSNDIETKQHHLSEWAFEVMHHVDAAQEFVMPYTGRLRTVLHKIPLERFIMLYPEEEFTDLHFQFKETSMFN